jgi:hypothetical protein
MTFSLTSCGTFMGLRYSKRELKRRRKNTKRGKNKETQNNFGLTPMS